MGSVRGLTAAVIGAVAAGPAWAEVCDKGGPFYAQPVHWIVALLIGLALWRGGRALPTIAALVALLVCALDVWGRVTEDDVLREMTESAIREACILPMQASIPLYLALAALALLRFQRRPL